MNNSSLIQETVKNEIRSLEACMKAMDMMYRTANISPQLKDLYMIRDEMWNTYRRLRKLEESEQDEDET